MIDNIPKTLGVLIIIALVVWSLSRWFGFGVPITFAK